jgi:hypothetical protein
MPFLIVWEAIAIGGGKTPGVFAARPSTSELCCFTSSFHSSDVSASAALANIFRYDFNVASRELAMRRTGYPSPG